ncbi:hypothetical protein Q7F20_01385 [Curtobacterium sp. A7_M15]|uniref:hypothetical protein n=1 Tax=Curtobacterium sp. A7_M15 TaxID=3065241 RepID=UPI002737F8CB|nr:hypothetical protein [Curtobacterium sp. A7_M15]MDP4332011.1 hypothetical protein [Curtobacterium sp. A7_M15]
MFGKKSRDGQATDAMRQAENIAKGRGLTGRIAKTMMGAENASRLQDAITAAQTSHTAADLAASGGTQVPATVMSVVDTGQMVNFDPIVVITATVPDGSTVQVQTLVSKLQIPRAGDSVLLVARPTQPGAYGYLGVAPAS